MCWMRSLALGRSYPRTVEGWTALIHPEDREPMSSLLRGAVHFHSELRQRISHFPSLDREQRWVHGLGRFELDERGRPAIMRGTIQDITERKRAEADLRQNEELLSSSFSMRRRPSRCSIADMRYIAASRRWLDVYG